MDLEQENYNCLSDKINEKGFTLIEVLIAIVILAIGCLVALYMQSKTIGGNSQADNLSVATFLAESEIEALKSMPFESLTLLVNSNNSVTKLVNRKGEILPNPQRGSYQIKTSFFAKRPTTFSHQVAVEVSWEDFHGQHNILYSVTMTGLSF